MNPQSRGTGTAQHLYTSFLRLYPAHFREEYGGEMARLFGEMCRDAAHHSGMWGVMAVSLRAQADTLKNSAAEWLGVVKTQRVKTLVFVGGLVPLAFAWAYMFLLVSAYTEISLVPWDTALIRPAEGTPARIVNDFFETPPGSFSLSYIVLAGSVVLLMRALLSDRRDAGLFWKFAIISAVFTALGLAAIALGASINWLLMPFPAGASDYGFHRSVIPTAIFLLAVAIYFRLLGRFSDKQATPVSVSG